MIDTTNIFETAARKKLRFTSNQGELTTEQIWELAVTSVDSLAQGVAAELEAVSKKSFIPKPMTAAQITKKEALELRLEILKHVITTKLAEEEARKAETTRNSRRQKILEALSDKEDDEYKTKSKEELLKELETL